MPRKNEVTKRQILDQLDAIEFALSSMMRRWDDDIPAEIRAEIMVEAYEPLLQVLIRTGRRGQLPK